MQQTLKYYKTETNPHAHEKTTVNPIKKKASIFQRNIVWCIKIVEEEIRNALLALSGIMVNVGCNCKAYLSKVGKN